MKKYSFLIYLAILFIGISAFNIIGKTKSSNRLPLLISYFKPQVPDSLQDFLKVYLQTKKIEVLRFDDYMALHGSQITSAMAEWINSGKVNNMTEAKAAEFKNSLKPVCNLLAIKIFSDSLNTTSYLIDSIHWYVDLMPVKDTSKVFKHFLPSDQNKHNPYDVLKSFADMVLQSKTLK